MFERHYREEKCLWGLSPDPLLAEHIEEIPVGDALDLGVGEGRNALYLAHKGFQVTGIDVSPKAVEKFLNLSKARGLKVEGLVADIRDFEFRPNLYSLVVASAVLHFFKKSEVYGIVSKIIRSIVPGGYVYIKDFTVNDPGYRTAKERLKQIEENTFYSSKLASYVYFFSPNELRNILKDFVIKAYKEEILTDHGHGNMGPHEHGAVTLLATKGHKCSDVESKNVKVDSR